MTPIITLTTDFGTKDHYVAAMKGVIYSRISDVRIVDITHEIPQQDIMAAAWITKNAAFNFPLGTINVVVVDPGVGTNRLPVAVKINGRYFIGPDNGIFSLLAESNEFEAVRLTNMDFWQNKVSTTFHGRDIFAPVAAALALGSSFDNLGESLNELVTYKWAMPFSDRDGIQGLIIHVDHYGNLITNIPHQMFEESMRDKQFKIYIGNTIIEDVVPSFGYVEEQEPLAYIGSSGMLEVGVNKANASQLLGIQKGSAVSVVIQK